MNSINGSFVSGNYLYCNGITVKEGIVTLSDGTLLPPIPSPCTRVVIEDNKVYANGYEFKRGKWRKTIKAILKTGV